MARFSPVRSQCQFDIAGERFFAERLEKLLEDVYLCSNAPFGPKARYPDLVVLHTLLQIRTPLRKQENHSSATLSAFFDATPCLVI